MSVGVGGDEEEADEAALMANSEGEGILRELELGIGGRREKDREG